MTELIELGEVRIKVTRKAVKNVHLSVHPPNGEVTLIAPTATRLEVARAYAISKLVWIRNQQNKLQQQAREEPRQYVTRETLYLWGQRYLLEVEEKDTKPCVIWDHTRILLTVRPGSDHTKRTKVIHEWHKQLLHESVPKLIRKWEQRLGVNVSDYFLQKMKTKWGSCNHSARNIRLNTELVKKPKEMLDYVVLHEVAHLVEPNHSERFTDILDTHLPSWRTTRDELNALPLEEIKSN